MKTQEINIVDEKLIKQRVDENIKLIYAPTRAFYNANEMVRVKYEFEELLSVSTIALHKAAAKFDESKGYKFSTFAVTSIKYALMGFTRNDKWYYDRKIVDGAEKFVLVDRVSTSATVTNGARINGDKDMTIEQSLEDNQNNYEISENKILVDYLLKTCIKRERDIIVDYFYNDFTQKQLSDKYKTSQSYISLVLKRNLKRFKKILGKELGYVRE